MHSDDKSQRVRLFFIKRSPKMQLMVRDSISLNTFRVLSVMLMEKTSEEEASGSSHLCTQCLRFTDRSVSLGKVQKQFHPPTMTDCINSLTQLYWTWMELCCILSDLRTAASFWPSKHGSVKPEQHDRAAFDMMTQEVFHKLSHKKWAASSCRLQCWDMWGSIHPEIWVWACEKPIIETLSGIRAQGYLCCLLSRAHRQAPSAGRAPRGDAVKLSAVCVHVCVCVTQEVCVSLCHGEIDQLRQHVEHQRDQ